MFLEFIKFSFLFVWFAMEIRINVVEIEPEQIRRCSYIYINDTHRVRSLVVVNKPETTESTIARVQCRLCYITENQTKQNMTTIVHSMQKVMYIANCILL